MLRCNKALCHLFATGGTRRPYLQETVMPSTHLYPDPSDLSPMFLSGQFDLDDTDTDSPFMLGEAMLSAQADAPPLAVFPVHHHARPEGQESSAFMFGLLPEQPCAALPDDLILNLGATEQA
jgi:hypothetical protein